MTHDCCPLCGETTWVITENGDEQKECCTHCIWEVKR
jgi:hypothetical protein